MYKLNSNLLKFSSNKPFKNCPNKRVYSLKTELYDIAYKNGLDKINKCFDKNFIIDTDLDKLV